MEIPSLLKVKPIDIVFRVIGTAESLERKEDVKALVKADNGRGCFDGQLLSRGTFGPQIPFLQFSSDPGH